MENSKYYTPEIEEFHVGFEYEAKNLKGTYDKKTCDAYGVFEIQQALKYDSTVVRIKLLDHEDIESLKWKPDHDNFFNKGDYTLLLTEEPFNMQIFHNITYQSGSKTSERIFWGVLQNKSELFRVMKQLIIK